MEERNILEGRTWLSLRYRGKYLLSNLPKFKFTQADLVLADKNTTAGAKTANARGRSYSDQEDKKILEFIIDRNEFWRVGGTLLWRTMADEQVAGTRSWNSMKNHFHQIILAKLGSYPFLSEQHRKNLMEKTIVKDAEGKVAEGQCRTNQPWVEEEDDVILSCVATRELTLSKLWKQMEEKNLLKGRSARSMKERYYKIRNKVKQGGGGEKEKEGREEDLLAVSMGEMQIAKDQVEGGEGAGDEDEEDMDASYIRVDF